MTNLTEIVQYEPGIYQLETTDPVLGGPDGIDNLQAKQLANRTAFLKKQLDDILSGLNVPVGLATINYIQAQLDKLDHKQSVRVATTANISLSGVQTIDGIAVNSGDRVLVKNQTDATTNGIYTANGSTWSRASDANEPGEVTTGLVVYVEEGALQGKSRWQVTTPAPLVLGTTGLTFGNITAGLASLDSPAFINSPTAPTLARFATGGGLINANALKARGIEAGGLRSIALSVATVNLTAADAGTVVAITGSGGGTLVLPAANSVPAGAIISVRCNNTTVSTNTLKGAGTDTIGGYAGNNANSTTLKSGDSLVLVSDGVSKWEVSAEATAAFIIQQFTGNQNLVTNGFQMLPGGLIIQWGGVITSASADVVVTLPKAYSTTMLSLVATAYINGQVSRDTNVCLSAAFGANKSTFSVGTFLTATRISEAVSWFSVGI